MPSIPDPTWTELELRLLRNVELFQNKPTIMKKAEGRLHALNQALQSEIVRNPKSCPEEADTLKGQIARGENNRHFPFLSLDMPQLFNKNTFYTFRTLFWWGHYLGFALILKGENFDRHVQSVVDAQATNKVEGIWFSLFDTPWEWELTPAHFQLLSDMAPEEIKTIANKNGYLKLLTTVAIDTPDFTALNWTNTGIEAYTRLTGLVGN